MSFRYCYALLLCCFLLGFAAAAEPTLTVAQGAQIRTYALSELLAHPAIVDVQTDASDEGYKRPMRYRGVPIETLLPGLGKLGDASVQFIALDGYAPAITAKRLTGVGAARAYLAVEPSAGPWPALAPNKPSAGPFYLVWSNAAGAGVAPSEWPYQIASIRVQSALAVRFPKIVPDSSAQPEVWSGFAAYEKHCFGCHTINRQGDAKMGPDLNVPMNPIEYFTENALKKLVRDPKSVRAWNAGVMPGFDSSRLGEAELDSIIAYLTHMVGKKPEAQQ